MFMIALLAGGFSNHARSILDQISRQMISLRPMSFLFRHKFESTGRTEPDALRISPAQLTFHQSFSIRIIRDRTKGATDHTHPAARTSVLIDRDRSGFAVFLNAQRWAEIDALRLIAVLAGNHIKNEIVFLIYA
jgi:hypothetical protein